MRPDPIAVIGAGLIGSAWAFGFARAGHPVTLWDQWPEAAQAAHARVTEIATDMQAAGLLDGQTPAQVAARVTLAPDLETCVKNALHVQESVSENVDVKRAVFAALDAAALPDAVLASSTSALLPSSFTETLKGRARCLVAHPINPPSLIPAVEIVPAPWTGATAMDRCAATMAGIGQKPIRMAREIDGFIMNRLQGALLQEAMRLVADGIATPEDIDTGIRDGLAPRWSLCGPFEAIDLNAPGGVRDYVARYGPMYRIIGARQTTLPDWEGATLDRIEAARRAALPLADLPKAQTRRDRRLMALMAHFRRETPQS
jgi:L-gulonate 3-dehydrogenase